MVKKTSLSSMVVILCVVVGWSMQATARVERADRSAVYVTVKSGLQSLGGFHGVAALWSERETVVSPDLDLAGAFGFGLGVQRRYFAGEAGLLYARSDVSWFDRTFDGSQSMLTFEGRIHPIYRERLQPYLVAGLWFNWITVNDGRLDPDSPASLGDAKLRGYGGCLGGGFQFHLANRLWLNADALYRLGDINRVKDLAGNWVEPWHLLDASGLTIRMGLIVPYYID